MMELRFSHFAIADMFATAGYARFARTFPRRASQTITIPINSQKRQFSKSRHPARRRMFENLDIVACHCSPGLLTLCNHYEGRTVRLTPRHLRFSADYFSVGDPRNKFSAMVVRTTAA